MKKAFYSKIAWNNIKSNYRFFIPRILSESGLLACFYIVLTLSVDERVKEAKGGGYIPAFMGLGSIVIGILSIILMFYINSFLMKQRTKELCLYNILGMEKRHVGRVLFFETFICSLISLLLGLVLGFLFYKLAALLIFRILHSSLILGFDFIRAKSLIPSVLIFGLLDLFTYLFNLGKLRKLKPVELLQSKSAGEGEPKTKWLMLVIGLLTLGTGYYLALTVTSPLEAIYLFFVAVILVIIGTYFLFVTGSIFVLKALKKNKKYYYNKKHFTSVSGLIYRMKQNAVGLASIAILATGVLIMVSCTVSLYTGMKDAIDVTYPQEMYINAHYDIIENGEYVKTENIPSEVLSDIVIKSSKEAGLEVKSIKEQVYLEVTYLLDNEILYTKNEYEGSYSIGDIRGFNFITADSYNKLMDADISLNEDEIYICKLSSQIGESQDIHDSLTIHGTKYKVVGRTNGFPIKAALVSSVSEYGVIVANETVFNKIFEAQKESYGDDYSRLSRRLAVSYVNRTETLEKGDMAQELIFKYMREYVESIDEGNSWGAYVDSVWDAYDDILGMYGSFLFLGIILGLVCMFATVLIIYYKQISEGYEDRDRYQIMKNVGMSSEEIKRSIGSQIIWIFFLPVVIAGIHVCVASPMLLKLLKLLMLSSTMLYIKCLAIGYVAFSLIYILIYSLTAKTYYKIIN